MDPRSTPLKPFSRMKKKTANQIGNDITYLSKEEIHEETIATINTYAPITWAPMIIEKKHC